MSQRNVSVGGLCYIMAQIIGTDTMSSVRDPDIRDKSDQKTHTTKKKIKLICVIREL